jgi:hypothetical protein
MTDTKEAPKTWSPMKMLDLCYRASDMTRELMHEHERSAPPRNADKLAELHTTLANFTNEVQHVWDEYVELLDLISEARAEIEAYTNSWEVRQMLDQHDYIIRTWDREE